MFIFEVDLFSHTSKGHIFTALPRFEAFLTQERGFPAFLKVGNPSIFIDFWSFSPVFLTQQHHSLNMCRRHTRNMSTITGRLWKEHVYWMRFSTGLQEIQDDISSKWEQMGSNHHSLYLISQRPDFPLPTQRTDLT